MTVVSVLQRKNQFPNHVATLAENEREGKKAMNITDQLLPEGAARGASQYY